MIMADLQITTKCIASLVKQIQISGKLYTPSSRQRVVNNMFLSATILSYALQSDDLKNENIVNYWYMKNYINIIFIPKLR